jgi:hypothetical protein
MNDAFSERLAGIGRSERRALTDDQKHWLRFRAPSCSLPDVGRLDNASLDAAVPCVAALYRDRIGVLNQRCEIDESHTLEEMATWNKPWSTKVPSGFKVDERLMTFVITVKAWIAESYNLPSEDLLAARVAGGGLKTPSREMALCRVTGPNGKRWLASPMRDGALSYVLESATEPASEWDAEQEREWQQRQSRRR